MMLHVVTTPDTIERPDEPWKYPYVAAVVDFGSNFQVSVQKASDRAVGYAIDPAIQVSTPSDNAAAFLDEFCEDHGINAKLRIRGEGDDETYRIDVTKRDDIQRLLRLVSPYLIARSEPAQALAEQLLPILDEGTGDRSRFLRAMRWVDKIRSQTSRRGTPKYTEDYFRDEWNL